MSSILTLTTLVTRKNTRLIMDILVRSMAIVLGNGVKRNTVVALKIFSCAKPTTFTYLLLDGLLFLCLPNLLNCKPSELIGYAPHIASLCCIVVGVQRNCCEKISIRGKMTVLGII